MHNGKLFQPLMPTQCRITFSCKKTIPARMVFPCAQPLKGSFSRQKYLGVDGSPEMRGSSRAQMRGGEEIVGAKLADQKLPSWPGKTKRGNNSDFRYLIVDARSRVDWVE